MGIPEKLQRVSQTFFCMHIGRKQELAAHKLLFVKKKNLSFILTANFLLSLSAPPVAEHQSPIQQDISVSLVVRNTHRWGSTSVSKVSGAISKMTMVSGGSLICPQLEKYVLCTFRKKSSRDPRPVHEVVLARLSTQSFSLWYILQENIKQDNMWVFVFQLAVIVNFFPHIEKAWFLYFSGTLRPYKLIFFLN